MAYCAWLHEQATASQSILPVAGVSWATLLASDTWQVRLPTEAEWEWAAGGPQQRRYPWGKTPAVEQANTLEGRVMGTSPVGAYPAGAAVCGALDMSGHVWEWTHSLHQPYPYRKQDGREDSLAEGRRVLRARLRPLLWQRGIAGRGGPCLVGFCFLASGFWLPWALKKFLHFSARSCSLLFRDGNMSVYATAPQAAPGCGASPRRR
jgi:formylglycine-generating enzyme required for sulfatase activity